MHSLLALSLALAGHHEQHRFLSPLRIQTRTQSRGDSRTPRRKRSLTLGTRISFVLAASALRHLVTDPLLPPELEPEGWLARHLRTAYGSYLVDYQAGLRAFFRRHMMSDA